MHFNESKIREKTRSGISKPETEQKKNKSRTNRKSDRVSRTRNCGRSRREKDEEIKLWKKLIKERLQILEIGGQSW